VARFKEVAQNLRIVGNCLPNRTDVSGDVSVAIPIVQSSARGPHVLQVCQASWCSFSDGKKPVNALNYCIAEWSSWFAQGEPLFDPVVVLG
jgi:hypothetical protein